MTRVGHVMALRALKDKSGKKLEHTFNPHRKQKPEISESAETRVYVSEAGV